MKRYEGLFIFDLAGREEGLKEILDKISNEITTAGGKIENVQKMDKKTFARAAHRKHGSGYYVNVIFQARPATLPQLRVKFRLSPDIFRVLFSEVRKDQPPAAVPVAEAGAVAS